MRLRRNRDGSEHNEVTYTETTGRTTKFDVNSDSDQFPATTGYYDDAGNYHEFPSGTHIDTINWSNN